MENIIAEKFVTENRNGSVKTFESPEITVIRFTEVDIITTSGPDYEGEMV